jgi:hypothetical protein
MHGFGKGFLIGLLVLLLAGCTRGDGVRERVFPPTASIQELVQDPAGAWTVKLRLQNFSNVSMRFDALQARLELGKIDIGAISLQPAIDVPGNSVEVLETQLTPPPAAVAAINAVLQSRAGIRYKLEGEIRSSEPRERSDEFLFESSLSPVPGLTGVLR